MKQWIVNRINDVIGAKYRALWSRERRRLARDPGPIPPEFVDRCLGELRAADDLNRQVRRHADLLDKSWDAKLSGVGLAACYFCYTAVRWLKPGTVVETGCATGWTSALILLALHQNDAGHLFTIDLPDGTIQDTGFLVPDRLRSRWTLELANTRDALVPLLQRLKAIDVFFHDSDHSYEHMMWEYTTAWPHIVPGGLLFSDDISMNTALWDFARATHTRPIILASSLHMGGLLKPSAV